MQQLAGNYIPGNLIYIRETVKHNEMVNTPAESIVNALIC